MSVSGISNGNNKTPIYPSEEETKLKTDSVEQKNTCVDGSQLHLLNNSDEDISSKQKSAQKQAMKLIRDAFERACAMSDERAKLEEEKSQKASELWDLRSKLKDIDDEKESLREAYGVEQDSTEQKDLELLEKYQDNKSGATYDSFSEEELERLKELQNKPLTEYQKNALQLNQSKDYLYMEMDRKKTELISLTGNISNIKSQMLQSQDMENAQDAADQLMNASNQEILGLLFQDGKESVDERADEIEEKSEEMAAQKEKLEKQQEKAHDQKAEQETLLKKEMEANKLKLDASNQKISDSQLAEAQKGIQQILKENHLINEDLKGIEIDLNF